MEQRLTKQKIQEFRAWLKDEEKSDNTIEKYVRDAGALMAFAGELEMTKETVIAYKNTLLERGYAPRSINSILASFGLNTPISNVAKLSLFSPNII